MLPNGGIFSNMFFLDQTSQNLPPSLVKSPSFQFNDSILPDSRWSEMSSSRELHHTEVKVTKDPISLPKTNSLTVENRPSPKMNIVFASIIFQGQVVSSLGGKFAGFLG